MNKHPQKQHRRVEAHNIATLCSEFPGKYSAPSDVYFGDIECVFSIFKDAEIDLAVLRVKNEVAQEDFDKKTAEASTQHTRTAVSKSVSETRRYRRRVVAIFPTFCQELSGIVIFSTFVVYLSLNQLGGTATNRTLSVSATLPPLLGDKKTGTGESKIY